MNKKTLLVGTFIIFSACSGSGIVPMGKDTFMVSKQGGAFTWAGGEVKAELYKEAYEFCQSKNKEVMPIYSASRDASFAQYATAELHFRCLIEGDIELGRPKMEPVPDIKIEMDHK